jgi:acyl-CoA-binding protein
MSDLTAAFEQAQSDLRTLTQRPSNDDLKFIYAHYKQATVGDASGSRPGRLDLLGRAKFDAWNDLRGTSSADAMGAYVAKVKALLETYTGSK